MVDFKHPSDPQATMADSIAIARALLDRGDAKQARRSSSAGLVLWLGGIALLIGLRLDGWIAWPWLVVLLPAWGLPLGLVLAAVVVVAVTHGAKGRA